MGGAAGGAGGGGKWLLVPAPAGGGNGGFCLKKVSLKPVSPHPGLCPGPGGRCRCVPPASRPGFRNGGARCQWGTQPWDPPDWDVLVADGMCGTPPVATPWPGPYLEDAPSPKHRTGGPRRSHAAPPKPLLRGGKFGAKPGVLCTAGGHPVVGGGCWAPPGSLGPGIFCCHAPLCSARGGGGGQCPQREGPTCHRGAVPGGSHPSPGSALGFLGGCPPRLFAAAVMLQVADFGGHTGGWWHPGLSPPQELPLSVAGILGLGGWRGGV